MGIVGMDRLEVWMRVGYMILVLLIRIVLVIQMHLS